MAEKEQKSSLDSSKSSRYRTAQVMKRPGTNKNDIALFDGILMKQIRLFSVYQDGSDLLNMGSS
jgi:hypothetical protein